MRREREQRHVQKEAGGQALAEQRNRGVGWDEANHLLQSQTTTCKGGLKTATKLHLFFNNAVFFRTTPISSTPLPSLFPIPREDQTIFPSMSST